MEKNKILRWLGVLFYMIGMVLTSFNFYPENLHFMVCGATFWTWAAVGVLDWPLITIEGIAMFMYGLGMINYYTDNYILNLVIRIL